METGIESVKVSIRSGKPLLLVEKIPKGKRLLFSLAVQVFKEVILV
jgi:hypothetical protein